MQIVIPMSGFGERFRAAGYIVPKPLIVVENKPIIQHLIERISKSPSEIELVDQLNSILGLLDSVPMKIHLWDAQNEIFEIINSYYPGMNAKKNDGNKEAKEWLDKMNAILKFLDISPQALI